MVTTNCSVSLTSWPKSAREVVVRARVDFCNSFSLAHRVVTRRLMLVVSSCVWTIEALRSVRGMGSATGSFGSSVILVCRVSSESMINWWSRSISSMRASCSVSRRWKCVPVVFPVDGKVGVLVRCCLRVLSSVSRVFTLMLIRSVDAADNLRSNVCRCLVKFLNYFSILSNLK